MSFSKSTVVTITKTGTTLALMLKGSNTYSEIVYSDM
jgi:hypothetical protein